MEITEINDSLIWDFLWELKKDKNQNKEIKIEKKEYEKEKKEFFDVITNEVKKFLEQVSPQKKVRIKKHLNYWNILFWIDMLFDKNVRKFYNFSNFFRKNIKHNIKLFEYEIKNKWFNLWKWYFGSESTVLKINNWKELELMDFLSNDKVIKEYLKINKKNNTKFINEYLKTKNDNVLDINLKEKDIEKLVDIFSKRKFQEKEIKDFTDFFDKNIKNLFNWKENIIFYLSIFTYINTILNKSKILNNYIEFFFDNNEDSKLWELEIFIKDYQKILKWIIKEWKFLYNTWLENLTYFLEKELYKKTSKKIDSELIWLVIEDMNNFLESWISHTNIKKVFKSYLELIKLEQEKKVLKNILNKSLFNKYVWKFRKMLLWEKWYYDDFLDMTDYQLNIKQLLNYWLIVDWVKTVSPDLFQKSLKPLIKKIIVNQWNIYDNSTLSFDIILEWDDKFKELQTNFIKEYNFDEKKITEEKIINEAEKIQKENEIVNSIKKYTFNTIKYAIHSYLLKNFENDLVEIFWEEKAKENLLKKYWLPDYLHITWIFDDDWLYSDKDKEEINISDIENLIKDVEREENLVKFWKKIKYILYLKDWDFITVELTWKKWVEVEFKKNITINKIKKAKEKILNEIKGFDIEIYKYILDRNMFIKEFRKTKLLDNFYLTNEVIYNLEDILYKQDKKIINKIIESYNILFNLNINGLDEFIKVFDLKKWTISDYILIYLISNWILNIYTKENIY